ncbi:uncharacterized protein F4807DRAFT_448893 [Annulohypoxylon truncatum]|uniref:uncharacterized protein n=1 Tax=Annulohypoxylon truncatum TaxID=327061 RepID=UPI002008BBD6|nr:uncharacterized protein F4807DRAFT_448893 [Annulohypoxylon truncatum]KAI1204137.1 hypothetical protein F4807DRAFT_448893 [Annulohypoxylon truncatum]
MPFQELISRLKSTRKPRDQERDSREDERREDDLDTLQQTKPTPQYTSGRPSNSQPKPVKGLRKASVSARLSTNRDNSNRPTDHDEEQDQEQDLEPEPSDYLYFGEGISATDISRSLVNQTQSKSVSSDISGHSSARTRNNPTPSSNGGKDNSGFIETGLNVHTAQMGYSNLTYGGSLQYDYSGTHGQPYAG